MYQGRNSVGSFGRIHMWWFAKIDDDISAYIQSCANKRSCSEIRQSVFSYAEEGGNSQIGAYAVPEPGHTSQMILRLRLEKRLTKFANARYPAQATKVAPNFID